MSTFPLRLDYYFITNTAVKAVPGSGDDSGDAYLVKEDDYQIEFAIQGEDEDKMIQCNISVNSTGCLPYSFGIEVVGFFSFDDHLEESNKPLYLINAPATLYSIVREQLASISAHGPYKKLILPLIDARGFRSQEPDSQKPKKASHRKTATTKKKASHKKTTAKKKPSRKKT